MSCMINPNFLPHKTSAFLFSLTITRATFTIFRVSIIIISICDTPDPWSSLMISSALWLVKVAPAFTPGREQTLTQLWGFALVGPSLLCNTLSCFLSLPRPSFFHLIHPTCLGPIYSFCFLRTHFSWKPSLIPSFPAQAIIWASCMLIEHPIFSLSAYLPHYILIAPLLVWAMWIRDSQPGISIRITYRAF